MVLPVLNYFLDKSLGARIRKYNARVKNVGS